MEQPREDYLRAMYCVGEKNEGLIQSIDIVNYLGVSKPAVSGMLKKLVAQKYIKMKPYSSIRFTPKGLREAGKLTYKHRISESFLRDILNVDKKDLHKEAHKLEHALSDNVAEKMAKFLDDPNLCPCGHEIIKPSVQKAPSTALKTKF